MKKQIVLEDDQLIEMVNESARRVLRKLIKEDGLGWNPNFFHQLNPFWDYEDELVHRYAKVNPNLQADLEKIGGTFLNKLEDNGRGDEYLKDICLNNPGLIKALANAAENNPEALEAFADNDKMATKLLSDPGAQAAFMSNPTVAADLYSGKMMQDAYDSGDKQKYQMLQAFQNGQVPAEAVPQMMLQLGGGDMMSGLQFGGYDPNTNQAIWLDGYGNSVDINQYYQQQNEMQVQNALGYVMNADTQIADLQQQISELEKTNPGDPRIQALQMNIQMIQNNKNMNQGVLQRYYSGMTNEYNKLYTEMSNDPSKMTQANQDRLNQLSSQIAAINGSEYYQSFAPSQPTQQQTKLNQFLGAATPALTLGLFGADQNGNLTLNVGSNNQNQPGWMAQQSMQNGQNTRATTPGANQGTNSATQGGGQTVTKATTQTTNRTTQPRGGQTPTNTRANRNARTYTNNNNRAAATKPTTPVTPTTPQAQPTNAGNPQANNVTIPNPTVTPPASTSRQVNTGYQSNGQGQQPMVNNGQQQPQPQQKPTVATYSAGGQNQPNPQQVPGRTIQAGALNANRPNQVAGYNPNFNPRNVQVRPMQVPQYPYQQQRR